MSSTNDSGMNIDIDSILADISASVDISTQSSTGNTGGYAGIHHQWNSPPYNPSSKVSNSTDTIFGPYSVSERIKIKNLSSLISVFREDIPIICVKNNKSSSVRMNEISISNTNIHREFALTPDKEISEFTVGILKNELLAMILSDQGDENLKVYFDVSDENEYPVEKVRVIHDKIQILAFFL